MKFKLSGLMSLIFLPVFSQSGSVERRIIFEDKAKLSETESLKKL
jgi:hypothetical protein